MLDAAKVSLQVASHTRRLPLVQGIMDIPSGLFPCKRSKPVGSSLEGTFAETSERWMMSLISPCLECRPWLHLQLKPWVAYWSTSSPQWAQMCGRHNGHPNLRPMAMLIVSSSIRRPREEAGRAFNHAPDSLAEATERRVLDLASVVDNSKRSSLSCSRGKSHAFCL